MRGFASKVKLVWFSFFFCFFFRFRFSFFDIWIESESRILTFKILFWHSNWVRKSYFDIQNPILTFELSRKILSKWDFPTQCNGQNRILNIKIGFSDSVRISKNEKRKAKNENQTNLTLLALQYSQISAVLRWEVWECFMCPEANLKLLQLQLQLSLFDLILNFLCR